MLSFFQNYLHNLNHVFSHTRTLFVIYYHLNFTLVSYNVGEIVEIKVKSDSSLYRIDIYRVGYYGGKGARKVDR